MKTKRSKPIKHFLNRLPPGIRELALKAYDGDRTLVVSQSDAIRLMCIWDHSEMGYDFWQAVKWDAYFNENGKEFGE